jgi:hypothetical protein
MRMLGPHADVTFAELVAATRAVGPSSQRENSPTDGCRVLPGGDGRGIRP